MYRCSRWQQWKVYWNANCTAHISQKVSSRMQLRLLCIIVLPIHSKLEDVSRNPYPNDYLYSHYISSNRRTLNETSYNRSSQPMFQHQESDYQQPLSSPIHLYMEYGQWRHEGLYLVPAFTKQYSTHTVRLRF
jgi:hypothetical protein